MHHYSSKSYVEASAKIDEVCAWLDELGIAYSRTRIGRYKELFASLARHQLSDRLAAFYEQFSFESLVNAAHEVAELERIYNGLSRQTAPDLFPRLKAAVKGQELYVLDSENRSGRDFSFELSMAAKFVSAGLPVDFGHDADVRVHSGGLTFFMECKRLKSPQQIRKRIKDGMKQLHKRYVNSEDPARARGMLALSIGKTVNKGLGLLEGKGHEELGRKAFAYNNNFIERYKSNWQYQRDRRTIGVVVVLDSPGIILPQKQLTTLHEVAINNSVPPESTEHGLLMELIEHVFNKRT